MSDNQNTPPQGRATGQTPDSEQKPRSDKTKSDAPYERQKRPDQHEQQRPRPYGRQDRPGSRDRQERPGPHGRRDRPEPHERRDRPGPHERRDGRANFQDRRERPADENSGQERPSGATAALIELDRDLMKLLVRRATLVSRIRGGKDHAATPAAIKAEKSVRTAWESGAPAFSRDPRFARQLFALLQDLKVLSKGESESAGNFNLNPAAKAVDGNIAGPSSTRSAQMLAALAAGLGKAMRLSPLMLSEALMDSLRAFAQAGARLRHEPAGKGLAALYFDAGEPILFAGKTIYAGDDLFTLHLLAFIAAGAPGVCRLNGGSNLKSADLSGLRKTLPLFGSRLANIVPHSTGLPANLESSGEPPRHVLAPGDLCDEGVSALLIAPLIWRIPITIDLSALPATTATAALAEAGPLYRICGADVETRGPHIEFNPGPLSLPEDQEPPLDPTLCAYLLALPAFAGGFLTLRGVWAGERPESGIAAGLLDWAGLDLLFEDGSVTAKAARPAFAMPLQCNDLPPDLLPLFMVLAGLRRLRSGAGELDLARLAPLPPCADEQAHDIIQSFFARLGIEYEEGKLKNIAKEAVSGQWTSPDAFWSMAYALAAYARPGLRLANPGNVSEVMPTFWSIYNSLPSPADPAAPAAPARTEEAADAKTARRRIIAE